MDAKVVEAIHLTYWLFSLLDMLGVDLVTKKDGCLITFENIDFDELPTETGQREIALVKHVTDTATKGYISLKLSGKRNTLRDYIELRRLFPRE